MIIFVPALLSLRHCLRLRRETRIRCAKLSRRSSIRWRGIAGRNWASRLRGTCVSGLLGDPRRPCCSCSSCWLHTVVLSSFSSDATTQVAACNAASGPRCAVVASLVTTLTKTVPLGHPRPSVPEVVDKYRPCKAPPRQALVQRASRRSRSSLPCLCGGRQTRWSSLLTWSSPCSNAPLLFLLSLRLIRSTTLRCRRRLPSGV